MRSRKAVSHLKRMMIHKGRRELQRYESLKTVGEKTVVLSTGGKDMEESGQICLKPPQRMVVNDGGGFRISHEYHFKESNVT